MPETRIYRLATFFRALSLEPAASTSARSAWAPPATSAGAAPGGEGRARFRAQGRRDDEGHEVHAGDVNCVGACALGPLVILDGTYHGNITSARLDKVLKPIREGA